MVGWLEWFEGVCFGLVIFDGRKFLFVFFVDVVIKYINRVRVQLEWAAFDLLVSSRMFLL